MRESTAGSRTPAEAAPRWTQARLSADGRSAVVPRDAGGPLLPLLETALAAETAASGASPAAAPRLRIDLTQAGRVLGTLEVGDSTARWVPAPGEGEPVLLALPAGLAQALRDEAARWVR